MLIRWAPAVVHLVAYYSNLLLLSSFFGLGVGALLAGRSVRLFRGFVWFVLLDVCYLLVAREIGMADRSEQRFVVAQGVWFSPLILLLLFLFNALVFVPLGQRLGELFGSLSNLRAYAWDLGGSLLGSVAFGVFSFLHFSPLLGFLLVAAGHCLQVRRRELLWILPGWVLVGGLVWFGSPQFSIWSPYHYVSVLDVGSGRVVDAPPPGLGTLRNPPGYSVSVNHDFYHLNISQDPSRYDEGHPLRENVLAQRIQYDTPYLLARKRGRVLVLGSGGGADVQGALRHGATQVDAVDIDVRLVDISRRFNPDQPYLDPRVSVHVDDARSFLAKATGPYDMVVFGYLDSQALFSCMNNIRLDGYVYTVESLRKAYSLVGSDGVMTLSFAVGTEWLARKLYRTMKQAVNGPVVAYGRPGMLVLCAGPGLRKDLPLDLNGLSQLEIKPGPIVMATDDWPYLYMKEPGVPSDYLLVIGVLLLVSVGILLVLRGRELRRRDAHFAALGAGFMLLETKSIGDCALYFGNTWFVTMVVVCGVLLMVLLANAVAGRLAGFRFALFVPLFCSLVLLWLVPRESILLMGFSGRLAWSLCVVPLPLFFAGLIFSTTFRDVRDSAGAFGANLIGALVGGFAEYAGMVVGNRALLLLILIAYLLSLVFLQRRRE